MTDCIKLLRVLLCFTGVTLSIYALHVESSKVHNSNYKAMCDISDHMSCSKVFASKYGTGFGLVEPFLGKDSILNVPNSIFGILFYFLVIFLGFSSGKPEAWLMFLSSFVSCVGCVYLAYILYFILEDACVVCITTYVVNAALLLLNYVTLKRVNAAGRKKKE